MAAMAVTAAIMDVIMPAAMVSSKVARSMPFGSCVGSVGAAGATGVARAAWPGNWDMSGTAGVGGAFGMDGGALDASGAGVAVGISPGVAAWVPLGARCIWLLR